MRRVAERATVAGESEFARWLYLVALKRAVKSDQARIGGAVERMLCLRAGMIVMAR